MEKPDYESIKENYETAYSNAVRNRQNHIHDYIANWQSVLNEIQRKVYDEIKSSGVALYPLYPVADEFVNFGNPFKKIGVEILYKVNTEIDRKDKLEKLKRNGWTIFTFESKYVSWVLEDVFEREAYKYPKTVFVELDDDDKADFIERHRKTNLECLCYHIMDLLTDY